jgi:hypothetical protein
MTRLPLMQRYFSRFMAIGVRNEHVRPVPVAQLSVRAADVRL